MLTYLLESALHCKRRLAAWAESAHRLGLQRAGVRNALTVDGLLHARA